MTSKFKAEVIEVYPAEGKAAVRFSWRNRDRVECVRLYVGPDCQELTVGMCGWAAYVCTSNVGTWGFTPFKEQNKKQQSVCNNCTSEHKCQPSCESVREYESILREGA